MNHIFQGLQLISIAGGAYVGFRNGIHIQTAINTPLILPWKRKILNFDKTSFITELMFCNIVGGLSGMMIGRVFLPVVIPYTVWYMEVNHGADIRKIIKSLTQ